MGASVAAPPDIPPADSLTDAQSVMSYVDAAVTLLELDAIAHAPDRVDTIMAPISSGISRFPEQAEALRRAVVQKIAGAVPRLAQKDSGLARRVAEAVAGPTILDILSDTPASAADALFDRLSGCADGWNGKQLNVMVHSACAKHGYIVLAMREINPDGSSGYVNYYYSGNPHSGITGAGLKFKILYHHPTEREVIDNFYKTSIRLPGRHEESSPSTQNGTGGIAVTTAQPANRLLDCSFAKALEARLTKLYPGALTSPPSVAASAMATVPA